MFFVGTDFTPDIDHIYVNFATSIRLIETHSSVSQDLGIEPLIIEDISALHILVATQDTECIWCTRRPETIETFLTEHTLPHGTIMSTRATGLESFAMVRDSIRYVFLADDILARIFVRRRTQKRSVSTDIDLLMQIRPGDYVVHRDHGIGKFGAVVMRETGGIRREYLEVHYRDNDKLYVPLSEVARLSRYVGEETPTLTRLSTNEWKKTVHAAEVDAERVAKELLDTYAQRAVSKGFSFRAFPAEETAFRRSFRYAYTPDQERSIAEVFADMERPDPMDRLLTGDV